MKWIFRFFLCIFLILPCFSCGGSGLAQPLKITISFKQEKFSSFDEVSARIALENTSQNDLLVNKRLYFQTDPFYPPEAIEGLFLVTDSSGRRVIFKGKVDFEFPKEDFFTVLSSGEAIERTISLRNLGFNPEYFRNGEFYSVIVVYQNDLDLVQNQGEKEIKSWTGKIQSEPVTFMIVR